MNNVFLRTLISQAESQIKNVTPNLISASNGFLPEKSLEHAIHELKIYKQILEQAKTSIHTLGTPTQSYNRYSRTNDIQCLK